jgi:hypothetical protein
MFMLPLVLTLTMAFDAMMLPTVRAEVPLGRVLVKYMLPLVLAFKFAVLIANGVVPPTVVATLAALIVNVPVLLVVI